MPRASSVVEALGPFAAGASIVLLLAGGGCRKRAPRPTQKSLWITGTLLEGTLGQPLPQFTFKALATTITTDARGRFRIHHTLYADRLPGPIGLYSADKRKPSERLAPLLGPGGPVRIELPEAAPQSREVDAGDLAVHFDEAVDQAFGDVCSSNDPAGRAPPKGKLLLFIHDERPVFSLARKDREPDKRPKHDSAVLRSLRDAPASLPWHAAACIDTSYQRTGQYLTGGPAYRTTWKVRLIRLSDGRVWKRNLSEEPPETIRVPVDRVGSGYGNPAGKLADWLRTFE